MKNIINWTFGSFFRTIGRIACYLIIGGILAYFVSDGFSKRDFRITDLFGIQRVMASSGSVWLGEVQQSDNTWYYSSLSPIYVERKVRTYTTYMNSVQFETNFGQYGVDKFYINGYIGGVNFTNYTTNCSSISGTTYTHCNWQNNLDDFQFQIWLGDNRNQCKIDYNNAMFTTSGNAGYLFWSAECFSDNNTTTNSIGYRLLLQDNIDSSGSGSARDYTFAINRNVYFTASDSQAIVSAQAQTTNAVNSVNQTLTDTNSTSDADDTYSFFNSYSNDSESQLSQVISAPLTLLNNLIVGTDTKLCFTLKGKQSCIPSGRIIWGKTTRTSFDVGSLTFHPIWFGSGDNITNGITSFVALFNLVVGGFLAYKMLLSLYRMVDDMLNPTNNRIEVLKL